jgi:hypothetical protein
LLQKHEVRQEQEQEPKAILWVHACLVLDLIILTDDDDIITLNNKLPLHAILGAQVILISHVPVCSSLELLHPEVHELQVTIQVAVQMLTSKVIVIQSLHFSSQSVIQFQQL